MLPWKHTGRLLVLFIFSTAVLRAQKQSIPKTFDLDELVHVLEKKYNLAFSFDLNLLKGVPVQVDTGKGISSLLDELSRNTAFVFDKIDRRNILIKPKSTGNNYLLHGFIRDSKTHEPLFSAIVYSRRSGFSISCSEDGSFHKIIQYQPGDSASVFLIGYEPLSVPIERLGNGEPVVIGLKNKLVEIEEVSVTAYLTSGIEYDAMDNSITMRPRNTSILPGQANSDLLLSLDALPGISSTDSKAGNLNIRGSTPDQTLITFDNIPLYQKGHIFGTISAFNANVVDNIKVQRSSMSTNKGGRVGGIIEINSPVSVANKANVTVSSSLMDANAYVHVPIVKNKLSFLVSGRHSYPYSWQLPPMKTISENVFQHSEVYGAMTSNSIRKLEVNYSDYNAKLIYAINNKHKAMLSALYNTDELIANYDDPKRGVISENSMKMENIGFNGMLVSKWSSSFSTQLSVTRSSYLQKNTSDLYALLPPNQLLTTSEYNNSIKDFRAFFQTEWHLSTKHLVKSGYELSNYNTYYKRESNDFSNVSYKQDYSKIGNVHTMFVNWVAAPVKKLSVDAGVRLNYYDVNQQVSPEPRLVVGYKLSDHFRLRTSGGYQRQFISQINGVSIQSIGGLQSLLWLLSDDKTLPVVNSYQGSFGGLFEKKDWIVDIEAYYKQTDNVANVSIKAPLAKNPFIHGSINTIGTDVLVKKKWNRLDTWISYTLSKSMMQFDSVQVDPFYSLYDQTHIIDLAGSYTIRQWKFSLAWKYRTGLKVLPGVRVKMMAGAESSPKPVPGATPAPSGPPPASGSAVNDGVIIYKDRFPDYHTLDASVQYSFPKIPKDWSGFVGVSVLNCYNQQNILSQSPIVIQGVKTWSNRYMMGVMPNLVVSFSF
jgi:hypothetical protein